MSTAQAIRPANADVVNINRAPSRRKWRPTTSGQKFPPEPITTEQFAVMLEHCTPLKPGPTYAMSAARLRGFICTGFRTGARISELLALRPCDLHQEKRAIVIRHGKGDKRRTVVMDNWGWIELNQWMRLRDAWLAERDLLLDGPIFCCLSSDSVGGHWHNSDVRRQLRELSKRTGLGRRLNPHALRHGFSMTSMQDTGDIVALQRQLGHENLAITTLYLRSIDWEVALRPIADRPPPMITVPGYDQAHGIPSTPPILRSRPQG